MLWYRYRPDTPATWQVITDPTPDDRASCYPADEWHRLMLERFLVAADGTLLTTVLARPSATLAAPPRDRCA